MNNTWKLLLNNTWIYYDQRGIPAAQVVRQGNHHLAWQVGIYGKPSLYVASADVGRGLVKQALGI